MKRTDRARGDGGQATVELVLLLPVVILLLLSAVQIAMVARDRVLLAHVAREAARAAAVEPEPAAATAVASGATSLQGDRLSVTLGPSRATGDRLTVLVSYRSPTTVPIVGLLVGDIRLTTEVTVRVE